MVMKWSPAGGRDSDLSYAQPLCPGLLMTVLVWLTRASIRLCIRGRSVSQMDFQLPKCAVWCSLSGHWSCSVTQCEPSKYKPNVWLNEWIPQDHRHRPVRCLGNVSHSEGRVLVLWFVGSQDHFIALCTYRFYWALWALPSGSLGIYLIPQTTY